MRRRFGPDVVLAVVLPLACALALLLLHPDRSQPAGAAPVETPLTSASVVCPGALPAQGGGSLEVTTLGADPATKVSGDLQVGLGPSSAPVPVSSGQVSVAPAGPGPAVVSGAGDVAPGL